MSRASKTSLVTGEKKGKNVMVQNLRSHGGEVTVHCRAVKEKGRKEGPVRRHLSGRGRPDQGFNTDFSSGKVAEEILGARRRCGTSCLGGGRK